MIKALVWAGFLGAISAALSGCDTPVDRRAPTRAFRLAAPTQYVYFDFDHGLRQVESIDDLPMWQQAAVILYDDAESAGAPGELVYVADLLAADAGATVQADLMTRRQHFRRARLAKQGYWQAHQTIRAAQEIAKLSPGSNRRAASHKALRKLKQMLPDAPLP